MKKFLDLTGLTKFLEELRKIFVDKNDATTKITVGEDTVEATSAEAVTFEGNGLTIKADAETKKVKFTVDAAAEYLIEEADDAEEGYLKTYNLTKDGTPVGASINIPKDFLVSGAEVITITDDNKAGYVEKGLPSSAATGEKYIEFEVNTGKSKTATSTFLYLNVEDLVDVYTGSDSIDISDSNIVSVKINSEKANGLSIGTNGIELALATAPGEDEEGNAGAISAADKKKLDDLAAIEYVGTNGVVVDTTTDPTKIAISGKVDTTAGLAIDATKGIQVTIEDKKGITFSDNGKLEIVTDDSISIDATSGALTVAAISESEITELFAE